MGCGVVILAPTDESYGFIHCETLRQKWGKDVLLRQKHVVGGRHALESVRTTNLLKGDSVTFRAVDPASPDNSDPEHEGVPSFRSYPQARQVCERPLYEQKHVQTQAKA